MVRQAMHGACQRAHSGVGRPNFWTHSLFGFACFSNGRLRSAGASHLNVGISYIKRFTERVCYT